MKEDSISAIVFDEFTIPKNILDDPSLQRLDLTQTSDGGGHDIDLISPLDEPRYAYFPWRNTLVYLPGPKAFRRIRLDRNRNKLTEQEQERAGKLTIGIVGLSVGHAVAHTLALEGLAGSLRLADFDQLELINLNRVPATIFDIGVNKAVVAARRIAEIDPYLPVDVFTDGVTKENIDAFLDGVDVLVEECDSFAIKVLVRQRCRALGIPVLMETSDRGTVDVERFDLEPDRPLFHGIVGDLDVESLASLDQQQLTAHAAAILEPAEVSARMAASALEIGRAFSAWPQLGGDVALGGASIATAIRRLVRGEDLPSGRVRIDIESAFASISEPFPKAAAPVVADDAPTGTAVNPAGLGNAELVAYAATRAPSAGNQQPWRLSRADDAVAISLDPRRSSTLDLDYRASAVALGAAVFNMRAAAAERDLPSTVEITGTGTDLTATVTLGAGSDVPTPAPGGLGAVLRRSTRRAVGDASPLSDNEIDALSDAATSAGTRLVTAHERSDVERFARIAADSDRIRFLTPLLHKEMFAELAVAPSTSPLGIDTDSLDLPPAMSALFDMLRRDEVMALLADWGLGAQLGTDAQRRILSSSAVIGLVQHGRDAADYLRAGVVTQRLWLAAESLGFAVHPVTPMFLYAHDADSVRALSPRFGDDLVGLRTELDDLWPHTDDEAITIALRLTRGIAAPPDAPSRRLAVSEVTAQV